MVLTIEKAIRRKTRERLNQEQRLRMRRKKRPVWRIRSGIDRGGSVDDTDRILLPRTVLSSDRWLLVPRPIHQTRNPTPPLWRRQRQLPFNDALQLRPFRLPIRPIYLQLLDTPAQKNILLLEELRFKVEILCDFGCDFLRLLCGTRSGRCPIPLGLASM